MSQTGTLRVRILGDSGPFEQTISGLGGKIAKFGAIAATAVAGFAAFSVKRFADFDQAMQASVAIMGDVSDEMRGNMSDAARQVARTTKFSAEEAAESYFFLASAGLDAAESIEALPRVAAFAQAGNFDMAQATDLLTDAQSALGLASDDAAESLLNMDRVGDVLVAANTMANASVEQFATSLTSKAGVALDTFGKDVEEGVAALSVFADQGIKGERAGTLLTNTLQGLSDNALNNADAFERLGVEVFDADGNMNNMTDIVGDLERGFEGMSVEQQQSELAAMGFNKQAREGILALVGNSDALGEYESDLRSAAGTVDDVAGKQLETFHAQLGLLKDQFFDVALTIGETLMPYIMRFVELLQENMPAIEAFIENALQTMGTVITDYVMPAFRALGDWWEENGPAIVEAAQVLWEGLKSVFDFIVDAVTTVAGWFQSSGDDMNAVMAEIHDFAGEVWPQIQDVISSAMDAIGAVVQFVTDLVKDVWDRWGDDILRFATTVWDTIRGVISGALNVIQGIFEVFAGLFSGDWGRMWDGVKQILSGAWEAIKSVVSAAFGALRLAFTVARDHIRDIWNRFWLQIRITLTNAWNGIKDGVSQGIADVLGFFRAMPGRILSAIGNVGSLLAGVARDIIDGFIGGIRDAFSGVRDAFSDMTSMIPSWKGPKSVDVKLLSGPASDIMGGFSDDILREADRRLRPALNDVSDMVTVGSGTMSAGGRNRGGDLLQRQLLAELKKMNAQLARGGDVYLDRDKVGKTLVKGVQSTQGGWR